MGWIYKTVQELSSNERNTTAREKSLFAREKPDRVSNPGPLGENREGYLCAMPPPPPQKKVVLYRALNGEKPVHTLGKILPSKERLSLVQHLRRNHDNGSTEQLLLER